MSQKKLLMQGEYGGEQWLGLPLFLLDSYLADPRWSRWTYYLEAAIYDNVLRNLECGRLKIVSMTSEQKRIHDEVDDAVDDLNDAVYRIQQLLGQ